jgi:ribosomal protein L37E
LKQQGVAITCDRCGAKGFLVWDPLAKSQEKEDTSWKHREGKDLCHKCGEQYDELIRDFFAMTR